MPAQRQPHVEQQRAHAEKRVEQDEREQGGLYAAAERIDEVQRSRPAAADRRRALDQPRPHARCRARLPTWSIRAQDAPGLVHFLSDSRRPRGRAPRPEIAAPTASTMHVRRPLASAHGITGDVVHVELHLDLGRARLRPHGHRPS